MSSVEQDFKKSKPPQNSILKQNQQWLDILTSELRRGIIKPPVFIDALTRKPYFIAAVSSKVESSFSSELSINVSGDGEIGVSDERKFFDEYGVFQALLGLTEEGRLDVQLQNVRIIQVGSNSSSFIKDIPADQALTDTDRLTMELAFLKRLINAGNFED